MHPIFAVITKVDEATRTITGRAVQEVVDRDNEIFDYASSRPEFERWSADVFADSGGKSYGNVRSMHSNIAAGKLTDIRFEDAEKAIDVSAKIIDEGEWQKCLEGVHTGFSIGGRYKRKWWEVSPTGQIVTRYTAVPTELSLVDRPAVPTAKFFSVHKKNGTIEKRAFAQPTAETLAKAVATGLALVGALPNGTVNFIKTVHARGPSRPEPDFLCKFPVQHLKKDAIDEAIAKAQRQPRALHPYAERTVDMAALARMLERGRRLRKLGLPPQSANGINGGALADDGADGTWNRDAAPSARTSQLGPRHAASISNGRAPATQDDVTIAALKVIFRAAPKRGL
jgi:hypothetical protein